MRVAVLYHCEQTTHRLDDALADAGAEVERFRLDLDEVVPSGTDFDAVVVLGGSMGAYEEEQYPWLVGEKEWLRKLVESRTPVLGICLGSQLLADALGGKAMRANSAPEVGVTPLRLTLTGQVDPVARHAGEVVYNLHQDTFELPPGADLLASSAGFPQAFRLGSALAVQFHPDADARQAIDWVDEVPDFLTKAGVEVVAYTEDLEKWEPVLDRNSRLLFRAFLETV
ncbi:MAG TPA: type 1 glutamine amidotransferase [Acidimicrobiia bacterium]|nr:type 1 glutamine amidotransferase [Acidimicrobiia bacterium]